MVQRPFLSFIGHEHLTHDHPNGAKTINGTALAQSADFLTIDANAAMIERARANPLLYPEGYQSGNESHFSLTFGYIQAASIVFMVAKDFLDRRRQQANDHHIPTLGNVLPLFCTLTRQRSAQQPNPDSEIIKENYPLKLIQPYDNVAKNINLAFGLTYKHDAIAPGYLTRARQFAMTGFAETTDTMDEAIVEYHRMSVESGLSVDDLKKFYGE